MHFYIFVKTLFMRLFSHFPFGDC